MLSNRYFKENSHILKDGLLDMVRFVDPNGADKPFDFEP